MGKKPQYIEIDGFLLPPTFDPEVFRAAAAFKPGERDVVVATFPKCGTTWAQQITLLILRKGRPPLTTDEYFEALPFLEMTEMEQLAGMVPPRCIKTHLPFDRVAFSTEAKYVYVTRHPSDCVVSFYHHTRYFPVYFFTDGSFDDFFDLFIEGKTDFNDYFDHLLSWYEHRSEPNVFFTTYESIKANPREMVLKLAKFLGDEYYQSLIENNEEILKKVLLYSSFEYMKSTINVFWNEGFVNTPPEAAQQQSKVARNFARILKKAAKEGHTAKGAFVRKGDIGDGKILLSAEQRARLKARILEKTSHSDVMNLWKDTKF